MFGKQTTALVASVGAMCPFESETEAIHYEKETTTAVVVCHSFSCVCFNS